MTRETRQKEAQQAEMEQTHPNAAGIDIGASEMWVAVPPGRAAESVRMFGTFTPDLTALADWLVACQVDTVALESTGVYWIPIYNILEARGLEVYLVNPLHLKRVPGRKSDVQDCQWLQQLHSYGLLSASFRPSQDIRVLRTLLRQRSRVIGDRAMSIQHMHQALQQMNLQLGLVVSDITGVTGMSIVRAILAGERDPHKLAHVRDRRCNSSEDTIAKALQGDYRTELVFVLAQAVALYDFYSQQVVACDDEIAKQLAAITPPRDPNAPPPTLTRKPNSHSKNAPGPDTPRALYDLTGVDLLALPGFLASGAQEALSETGFDMTPWRNDKAFCSWLSLAPHNDISGGKVLRSRTLPSANRAAQVFRRAAQSAGRGQTAIGAYYRRMCERLGPQQAIVATAHKLARIYYHMLKDHVPYQELGAQEYERQHQQRVLRRLEHQAAAYGYVLAPQPSATG